MLIAFLLFLILQLVLLVFSPNLRSYTIFRWYYERVYYPVFKDSRKYRWKFWVVPTFYVAILLGCTVLFFHSVYPLIANDLLAIERVMILPLIEWPLIAAICCFRVSPISAELGPKFPYDNIIFHSTNTCKTCLTTKAPRSKHCSICGNCVSFHDHHCIWINNCVGFGNYQYFYSFLLANCILLTYASLRLASFWSSFKNNKFYLSLLLLTSSFGVIMLVFSYSQLRLISSGMTNSEEEKWYIVQEFMRDGNLVRDTNGMFLYRVQNDKTDKTNSEYLQWESDTHDRGASKMETFYSTNPYDHKLYKPKHYKVVHSHEEIENIYDKGSFWINLSERISLSRWR